MIKRARIDPFDLIPNVAAIVFLRELGRSAVRLERLACEPNSNVSSAGYRCVTPPNPMGTRLSF
jgi:hypothetical protein